MTNEEAIKTLSSDGCYECSFGCESPAKCPNAGCDVREAVLLAISALSRDRWISVEEPPEPLTKAIVYSEKTKDYMVGTYTEWGWMFPCYFGKPSHWKLLPEPPKEDKP